MPYTMTIGWQRQDNGSSLNIDLRGKWVKTATIQFRGVKRDWSTTEYSSSSDGAGGGSAAGTHTRTSTPPSVPSGWVFHRIDAATSMTVDGASNGEVGVQMAGRARKDSAVGRSVYISDQNSVANFNNTSHYFTSPTHIYSWTLNSKTHYKKTTSGTHQTQNPSATVNSVATAHSGTLNNGVDSPVYNFGGLLSGLADDKQNSVGFSSSGSNRCEVQIIIEWMDYPEVDTLAAQNIAPYSARIRGDLTSTGNATTTRYIEYADTSIKLGTVDATVVNSGSTTSTGVYVADIGGLAVDTTYYFRAYATNTVGTTYGGILSFTTQVAPPAVTTDPETDIDITSVTLRGTVTDTGGEDPQRSFEWGALGGFTAFHDVGIGGTGAYSYNLTGLTFETEYQWRAYAMNSSGTTEGVTRTFETLYPSLPAPAIESPLAGERLEVGEYEFIFTLTENADNPTGSVPPKYHARLRISGLSDMSGAVEYESKDDQTGWEYWDGAAWLALPAGGVVPGAKVKFTTESTLAPGIWYWDCASHDGYVHPNTLTGRYGYNSTYRRLSIVLRIANIYVLTVGGVEYDVYNLRVTETSNGELGEIQFEVSNEGYEAATDISHNDVVAVGIIDSNGIREDFSGRVRNKTPQGTSMVVRAIMGDGLLAERTVYTDYPKPADEKAATFASTGAGVDTFTYTRTNDAYDKDGVVVATNVPVYENDGIRIVKPTENLFSANQSNCVSGWTENNDGGNVTWTQNAGGLNKLTGVSSAIVGAAFVDVDLNGHTLGMSDKIVTFRVYVKCEGITAGSVGIAIYDHDSVIGDYEGTFLTLPSADFEGTYTVTRTLRSNLSNIADSLKSRVYMTGVNSGVTLTVSLAQLEESAYATPWQLGATSRLESDLSITRAGNLPDDFSYSVNFEPLHASTVAIDRVLWEQGAYECLIESNRVKFTNGVVIAQTEILTWSAGDDIYIEAGRDDVSGELFINVEIGGTWYTDEIVGAAIVSGTALEVGGGTSVNRCEGYVSGFTYYEVGNKVMEWSFDNTLFAFPGMVAVTSASHGYGNGDRVLVTETNDYNDSWTIVNVTADAFILDGSVYVGDESGKVNFIEDVGQTVKHIIDDYCTPLTSTNVDTATGFHAPIKADGKTAVRVIEDVRRSYGLQYYVDVNEDVHLYKAGDIASAEKAIQRGGTPGTTNMLTQNQAGITVDVSEFTTGNATVARVDLFPGFATGAWYGTHSMEARVVLGPAGPGRVYLTPNRPVVYGESYTFSCYRRMSQDVTIELNVRFYTGVAVHSDVLRKYEIGSSDTLDWTRLSFSFAVPVGADGMRLGLTMWAAAADFQYFDGLQLQRGIELTDWRFPVLAAGDTEEGFLFFNEPTITINPIIATHVKVKSPTAEHTESLTVAADARIDRLVPIESGDADVCEEVATTLLAKWGKEQLNVAGKLAMNLAFSFKEKVRTILNYMMLWVIGVDISLTETFSLAETWRLDEPAEDWFLSDLLGNADTGKPDEELILQRKTHTLTDYATEVSLGDIQLDDNELVARILEKFEG